jgi:predicted branched-subunit amino acid permease
MSSIYRTLPGGVLRDIALTCLAVSFIGLSYGAIAVASGFPLWVPAAQSVLVLAGASEFLFIGIVAAGGSPIAAALAGVLVNARHVPYGLALPDITGPDITGPDITGPDITGPGVTGRGWRRILGSHVMNDESVAFALAQEDLPRKRAAYWACGLGVLICWPGGAILGALIGGFIKNTNAFGLDAMFPAVLLALIVPALRDRVTLRAAVLGAVIALAAAPFLPAGLPVLLALAAVLALIGSRAPLPAPEPPRTAPDPRTTPDPHPERAPR